MAKKSAKSRSTKTLGDIFGNLKKGKAAPVEAAQNSNSKTAALIKQRMAQVIASLEKRGKK